MSDQDSCLVQKLSHYIELTDQSREHLARLEQDERNYEGRTEIFEGGDEARHLYVVKKGWLYSYTDLPDGRRQIVRIHHPGDIIGFPDIAFEDATTSLRTVEKVCLCPFPKTRLDAILANSPQLTALLFTLALREQVILIDLIRAMGRMSARERIAFMLLDLVSRLRITNKKMTDTFRLPLRQGEIGDVLGLTNVYVSKTFMALEEEGYLSRQDGMVTLRKEAALKAMCDYFNRYDDMDTSWFPEAAGT